MDNIQRTRNRLAKLAASQAMSYNEAKALVTAAGLPWTIENSSRLLSYADGHACSLRMDPSKVYKWIGMELAK